ncbi:MAG TPA: type II toxin-antitoxin system RelE/ParE family toxin [Longimicrobium sp.]|nr:type II toxin-antitoxin system RelE/ParE family toxin [Longimicrobium sp.]
MSRPLILRPVAEDDVEAAYRWYEEQSPGLGAEFLRSVEVGLASIERNPEACQKVYKHARRALLRRFPYALFYVASPELIEVIGCIHTRRHPRHWRSRL